MMPREDTMRRTYLSAVLLILLSTLIGCSSGSTSTPPPRLRLPSPTPYTLPTITWTPHPTSSPVISPTRVLATPSPGLTPTPKPSPAPYGWVRPLQARLREKPSLEARTITLVPGGTTVQILGQSRDRTWYRVRVIYLDRPPQEGWMAAGIIATFVSSNRIPLVTDTP